MDFDDYLSYISDDEYIELLSEYDSDKEDEEIRKLIEELSPAETLETDTVDDSFIWSTDVLASKANEKILEKVGKNRVKARLFLNLITASLNEYYIKRLELEKKKKLGRKDKTMVDNHKKHFLLNCIRTTYLDIPPLEIDQEMFMIEQTMTDLNLQDQLEEITMHNNRESTITQCPNCGSANIRDDPVMQQIICMNCSVVTRTEPKGITFSHLAQSAGGTKTVVLGGKKVYLGGVNGIQGVIERFIKKVYEYPYIDQEQASDIITKFKSLPVRDSNINSIKDIIVKLIISLSPMFYTDSENLRNLISYFNIKNSKFNIYNEYADFKSLVLVNRLYENIIEDEEGDIIWDSDNVEVFGILKKILTKKTPKPPKGWTIQNNLLSLEQIATLFMIITGGERKNVAPLFGVTEIKLTNLKNDLTKDKTVSNLVQSNRDIPSNIKNLFKVKSQRIFR